MQRIAPVMLFICGLALPLRGDVITSPEITVTLTGRTVTKAYDPCGVLEEQPWISDETYQQPFSVAGITAEFAASSSGWQLLTSDPNLSFKDGILTSYTKTTRGCPQTEGITCTGSETETFITNLDLIRGTATASVSFAYDYFNRWDSEECGGTRWSSYQHRSSGTHTISTGITLPDLPPSVECPVPPLTPLRGEALEFEGSVPSRSTSTDLDPVLFARLQEAIRRMRLENIHVRITSGYRPAAYQAHFRELFVHYARYKKLAQNDPVLFSACADRYMLVWNEIHVKHGIFIHPKTGLPAVSVDSDHSEGPPTPVADLSISQLSGDQRNRALQIAQDSGLKRPCIGDLVHFSAEIPKEPCPRNKNFLAIAECPVNIMVTDPFGRRVGFDAVSGFEINEVGPRAYYSGSDSEPQMIIIESAEPGDYIVTGIGTGYGPYVVTTYVESAHGDLVGEVKRDDGEASPEAVIGPIYLPVPLAIEIDVRPDSDEDKINPSSKGVLPLALLGSDELLVSDIEVSSIRAGRTGDEVAPSLRSTADVNGDGRSDLLLKFPIPALQLQDSSVELRVSGRTKSGIMLYSIAPINIVP